MTERLRIGVLCDGNHLSAWQAKALREVLKLNSAKIALLIFNGEPPTAPEPVHAKLKRNIANDTLIWRIYERLVLNKKVSATHEVEFPKELQDVPRLTVIPGRHGKFRRSLAVEDVDALRRQNLDVLIRFGFGILTGEILNVARYGIWSFHHGDPQEFRGAPPGFWEIHNRATVTGVVLQRLTEKLDGGIVLRSGWFKTIAANYPKSLDRILFGATHFIAQALDDLHRNPATFERGSPVKSEAPVYRYPDSKAMLRFFFNSSAAWLSDQFHSLFNHQQWTLGIVKAPVGSLYAIAAKSDLVVKDVDWMPERRGRFLADPFALNCNSRNDDLVFLAEEYDWHTGLGQISKIRYNGNAMINCGAAICSTNHLSYPYVIEEQGRQYCVPECAGQGFIELYELEDFSQRWVQSAVLVNDVSALDPSIFKYGDKWWLFCTDAERGGNEVLLAWHAEKLLGPWLPHSGNPIKIDVRSSRPAGRPFIHDGDLIRPAQDCSGRYGGRLIFNRVSKLSTDEFEETVAGALMPDPAGRYRAGLHTICSAGEWTVIDGARPAFHRAEMRRAVARKLGFQRA